MDHLDLVVDDSGNIAAIRDKVERGGWQVIAELLIAEYAAECFAFVGPDCFTWRINHRETPQDWRSSNGGLDRFVHINLKVTDSLAMRDYQVDTFDFRVSDQVGADAGFLLRCTTNHHGITILKSPEAAFHHHA